MRDASKKVFDFGVFLVQWETVLDRIFEFNSPVKKMFFGSRFQWKIFIATVRNHIRLRYETNEFPRHNSASAPTAASLNRFYWEPTGGRCVFEC